MRFLNCVEQPASKDGIILILRLQNRHKKFRHCASWWKIIEANKGILDSSIESRIPFSCCNEQHVLVLLCLTPLTTTQNNDPTCRAWQIRARKMRMLLWNHQRHGLDQRGRIRIGWHSQCGKKNKKEAQMDKNNPFMWCISSYLWKNWIISWQWSAATRTISIARKTPITTLIQPKQQNDDKEEVSWAE